MHYHEKVILFNKTVLGIPQRSPHLQPFDEFRLTQIQLEEEMDELLEAYMSKNLVEAVDAGFDLIYFAYGMLYKMGVTDVQMKEIERAIHTANMNKKKGVKETRIVDGSPADAIKPDGWIAPEYTIAAILGVDYVETKEES